MLKLAYFFELTWLMVDSLSGYFQNSGILFFANQTLGSFFRIFVFFFFVLILLKHSKGPRIVPFFLLSFLIIFAMSRALYFQFELVHFLNDVQFQVKILMAIILYNVYEIQLLKGALSASQINKIVFLNAAVLVLNIFLGFIGVGFGSYGMADNGDMLGSKGFLFAGNEVAITLVAIFGLIVFLKRNTLMHYFTGSILLLTLFFVASISLLSKTSVIGFVLVASFAIYNYLSLVSIFKLTLFFIFILTLTSGLWLPILNVASERWQFFYAIAPDALTFVTSGRVERLEDWYSWLNKTDSVFPVLIGLGHLGDESLFSFENDLMDLIVKSGFFGLFIYLSWLAWMLGGIKDYWTSRSETSKFTVFMLLLILTVSIFAGHVIYSVMLAPFVALIALISSNAFYLKIHVNE